MAARRIQTGTTRNATPSRRVVERTETRRQTSAGEIADMPDFGDMLSDATGIPRDDDLPTPHRTSRGEAGSQMTVRRRVPNGTNGNALQGDRRDRHQGGVSTSVTSTARRMTPPRETRVTPSSSTVSDVVRDDEKAGGDGFLGWYLDHQWVSFVISAVSIAVGMIMNRYVSVVVAVLLLGVGYLAEQQDVDDDSMPTYIAAMLAFFIPFIY